MPEHWLIWTVVILAVLFDYINGFHDTANAIATSVSTRAISPNHAILMAAGLNFLGAMVSTGVATGICPTVINPKFANGVDKRLPKRLAATWFWIRPKSAWKLL